MSGRFYTIENECLKNSVTNGTSYPGYGTLINDLLEEHMDNLS